MTVYSTDEVEIYDGIADAVQRDGTLTLLTSDGASYAVPPELVAVIREAAQYLARDKAVEVSPRSRYRFL